VGLVSLMRGSQLSDRSCCTQAPLASRRKQLSRLALTLPISLPHSSTNTQVVQTTSIRPAVRPGPQFDAIWKLQKASSPPPSSSKPCACPPATDILLRVLLPQVTLRFPVPLSVSSSSSSLGLSLFLSSELLRAHPRTSPPPSPLPSPNPFPNSPATPPSRPSPPDSPPFRPPFLFL